MIEWVPFVAWLIGAAVVYVVALRKIAMSPYCHRDLDRERSFCIRKHGLSCWTTEETPFLTIGSFGIALLCAAFWPVTLILLVGHASAMKQRGPISAKEIAELERRAGLK